jgi:hypothetical protein
VIVLESENVDSSFETVAVISYYDSCLNKLAGIVTECVLCYWSKKVCSSTSVVCQVVIRSKIIEESIAGEFKTVKVQSS